MLWLVAMVIGGVVLARVIGRIGAARDRQEHVSEAWFKSAIRDRRL